MWHPNVINFAYTFHWGVACVLRYYYRNCDAAYYFLISFGILSSEKC